MPEKKSRWFVRWWRMGGIRRAVVGVLGLLLSCMILGIIVPRQPAPGGAGAASTQVAQGATATLASTATEQATNTPRPTKTPAPTATPAPTLTAPEQVRAAVEDVLRESNRDVKRVITAALPEGKNPQIYIRWTINDNLTEGMITGSARNDATKILRAIHDTGIPFKAILIEGIYPLADKFGASTDTIVVHALYTKATIDRIEFDNFLSDNVYAVADEANIHPVFQK